MGRRARYYFIGVLIGCLILIVLPVPYRREGGSRTGGMIAAEGTYPLWLKDGYDRRVKIEYSPRRIVSLAPSITEIIFALKAEDRLVGNTTYCNYPEGAQSVPKIGDLRHPNIELIVQLQPDLVLGTVLSSLRVYDRMEAVGLTSAAFEHGSFEEVLRDIGEIGKITGLTGEALRLISGIEKRRDEIAMILEGAESLVRPRVALLYDLEGLHSAGRGSWAGDLIELCYAENVAAKLPSSWPQLSLEGLVKTDPQVLILAVPLDLRARQEAGRGLSNLAHHEVWRHVSAVRNRRLEIIREDLFAIPGPRMIDALEELVEAIHPELFGAD